MPSIPHPPYLPDLAPSDYYLFSSLKSHFSGKNFLNQDDVKVSICEWLKIKEEDFFATGINMLPARWTKCVEANGEYFDTE